MKLRPKYSIKADKEHFINISETRIDDEPKKI